MQPQPASWFCTRCGASNWGAAAQCAHCGSPSPFPQPAYYQPPPLFHMVAEVPKSRGVYAALGLLFGGFGVHNFYAGRINPGIMQLLFMMSTFWLCFPIFVIWLWAVIEVIVVDQDGRGLLMR